MSLSKDEKRRIDQQDLNVRWLIGMLDEAFYALCPDKTGTWQQRAEMLVEKAKELGKKDGK